MSDALYERYKDALRRGHIAALRERHEDALGAYLAAADLAPDRPLPHASVGATLLRLGRPEEALVAFDRALARSPIDESALAGRADALVALGRPADAAATLDRLADALERGGRLAAACDTARRALELAESRTRRRHVRELVARLRATEPDDEGATAVARALQVLEPPAAPGGPVSAVPSGAPSDEPPTGAGEPVSPAPEPPAQADVVALVEAAEAALAADDRARAVELLGQAVAAHRARGEWNAALDAASRALVLDPVATDPHVALARLYAARGWRSLAGEKLVLLARLAALRGDDAARDRLRSVAQETLPEHAELAALLA